MSFGLYLWEIASLVILSNSCGSVFVKETSKLLHPLTVNPLSSPYFQQRLSSSAIIIIVHLIGYSPIDVHKIIDIDLDSFTVTKSTDKLLCVVDLHSIFALLEEVAIYDVDEIHSEG